MPAHSTTEDFARLQARVAELEAGRARRSRRRRRAWLPAACLALLVALVPLGLLAANPFTDLTGGPHDANIDAIYNAGVTRGCVPDQEYCPTRNVTREEMASFLARLGGLGGNAPVAHALTAETAQTATSAQTAGHAGSADTATNAGHATSADSATSADTAASADKVDSYDANALVRVARAVKVNVSLNNGALNDVATVTIVAPAAGFVAVSASGYVYTTSASGCPCTIVMSLYDVTGGTYGGSLSVKQTLPNATIEVAAHVSLSDQWVFPVAAGPRTFVVRLQREVGTASVPANAVLTAIFSPFGPGGGSTIDLP